MRTDIKLMGMLLTLSLEERIAIIEDFLTRAPDSQSNIFYREAFKDMRSLKPPYTLTEKNRR